MIEEKHDLFDRQFKKIMIGAAIILIAICILPFLLTIDTGLERLNFKDTGEIGDTISGTMSPFIAIVAAFLTFLAFWIQYKANEQQKRYISRQRFEDTFFRMLDNHQNMVNSMDIRSSVDEDKVIANGKECFRNIYLKFKETLSGKNDIEAVNREYDAIQKHFRHDLHHYFRFLYHTLKFIKYSDISEEQKYQYTSILRATLSAYELAMIFYNGLHVYGKSHFKPLIEEFSFLKNIDGDLIINKEQENEYHALAFASSETRPNLLKDWKMNRAS